MVPNVSRRELKSTNITHTQKFGTLELLRQSGENIIRHNNPHKLMIFHNKPSGPTLFIIQEKVLLEEENENECDMS